MKLATKEKFLEGMAAIYDRIHAKFNAPEEAPAEAPATVYAVRKAEHGPYRSRREYSRIDTIARHYEVPVSVIRGACEDAGTDPVYMGGRHWLPKDDVTLLVMLVARKYDNYDGDICY